MIVVYLSIYNLLKNKYASEKKRVYPNPQPNLSFFEVKIICFPSISTGGFFIFVDTKDIGV